jgi:hypothetical protein
MRFAVVKQDLFATHRALGFLRNGGRRFESARSSRMQRRRMGVKLPKRAVRPE